MSLDDTANGVADYQYDDLNRRVRKCAQNSPGLTMTYHAYASAQRTIETRKKADQ